MTAAASTTRPGLPTVLLSDPVALTQALVRCPSVTPAEAGALDLAQGWLTQLGFDCRRIVGTTPGAIDVDNLYGRRGRDGPHLCFAGHVDVVPVGDEAAWTHPPFGGAIDGARLFGRGVVDMKGNIGAFIAAVAGHLAAGREIAGSISLLLTCDEEGPSINGTAKVLEWMSTNGELPDHALVGEPTNPERLGDAIKIGRRGSLNGAIIVHGRQGHAAYPHLARNPVHGLARVVAALTAEPLDRGNARFDPSNLEVVAFEAGGNAYNVIPNRAEARLNIRFNDEQTAAGLEQLVRADGGADARRQRPYRRVHVSRQRRCVRDDAGAAGGCHANGDRRGNRPAAGTVDQRRYFRRALHQELLPGNRVRPRQ